MEKLGYTEDQLSHGGLNGISKKIGDYKKMAQEMGVGEITLRDIPLNWKNRPETREMRCRVLF